MRLQSEEAGNSDAQHHQQEECHPEAGERGLGHIGEYFGLDCVIECLKQSGSRGHGKVSGDDDRLALFFEERKDLDDLQGFGLCVEGIEGGFKLGETVGGEKEGTDSLLLDGKSLQGSTKGGEVCLSDWSQFCNNGGGLTCEELKKLL